MMPMSDNDEFDLNDYADLFSNAEQKYGLPSGLLYRVANQESQGDPMAEGPPTKTGERAQGLMQIMPSTAKALSVDPYIPSDAVDGAARLLRQNLDRYKNIPDALRAYNSGTDSSKWNNKQTNNYVKNILADNPKLPPLQQFATNVTTTPLAYNASDDPLTQAAAQSQSDDPLMSAAAKINNANANAPDEDDPLMSAAHEITSGIKITNKQPVPGAKSSMVGDNSATAQPSAAPSTLQDIAESIPTGLVQGVNNLTKIPVGMANLAMQTGQQISNKLYNAIAKTPLTPEQQTALIRNAGSNLNDYVPTVSQASALISAAAQKLAGESGKNVSYGDIAREALNSADNSPVINALHQPVTPTGSVAENVAAGVPAGLIGGINPMTAIGASAANTAVANYFPDNPFAQITAGIVGAGLGKATGALAGKTYNAVRGIEPPAPPIADNILTKSIQNSHTTPSEVETKLNSMGDNAMLADAGGEGTRDVATAIANMPGPAKDIAIKALEERQAGQSDRITQAALQGLGVNASDTYGNVLSKLDTQQAELASPLYDSAFSSNKSVSSPVINRILDTQAGTQALKFAAMRMNNRMALMGVPDPELAEQAKLAGTYEPGSGGIASGLKLETLDLVKQGLDDQIGVKLRAGENGAARDLIGLKNGLVKELDANDATAQPAGKDANGNPTPAVMGDYAKARQTYAGKEAAKEALDMGYDYITKGDISDVSSLTDAQKIYFRVGIANKISDILQNTPDGADAVKRIFGNQAKRAKLASVFPDTQSFQNFENIVNNEKEFTKTYQAAMVGSRTTPLKEKIENLRNAANQGAAPKIQAGLKMINDLAGRNTYGMGSYVGGKLLNKLTEPREFPESEAIELANKLFTPNSERGGVFPVKPREAKPNLLSSYIEHLARGSGVVVNPALPAPRPSNNPINSPQNQP
jgi:Transglycosylase SLT domain